MLKMMNRAKKNNHQSSQRSKDAKAARNGVGAGANVGPAKPSLAQMGPQPAASVPGQPTAPSASVSGGGRTKKVKQTSANKTAAASVGGTARRARATAKETMPSKANESTRSESNADNGVGGLASVSEQPVGPKMERSNSFFLTRKLSSLYSKLSGSRENVSTTNAVSPVTEALPFQFVRSRSMSSIQLKRAYRRSQNESTLQNLHEDAILERSESTEETAAVAGPEVATAVPEVTPPPIPRFERSNSILASIRRKISFRSDRRSSNVSNWSASLQNLRQEDFMISYDDLSFIDYDQFNSYETNILKRRSSRVLEPGTKGSFMEDISSLTNCAKSVPTSEHLETVPVTEATNGGVVRRRRKNDTLLRTTLIRKSMDVEGNLDRDKNVYRNSLDADKLMCISNVNRKSFRWSADVERDVVALDLESADFADAKPLAKLVTGRQTPPPPYDVCDSGMIDGSESVKLSAICDSAGNTRSSVGYVSRSESLKRCRSYGGEGGFAFEEGFDRPAKQIEMKSLSLTHLDEIERQATAPTIITNDPHVRKSDNSDTSNTSIASASGSAGYGGNTVSGGSSTHAVSPKDVCLTVTSGSALIDISNSDGGCINPAYDNGEGSQRRQAGNSFTVSEVDARIVQKQNSTEKVHECQSSGTCCMLSSPSCVKAALGYSTKLGGTSSTSSLKKKSSSFLHRERKKPVLTRSQVSSSEYFSVCFESDQNDPGVLIPATKGVRLAECLRASLSRRSLSFSQIYVTDNGFNNPHETGLRYTEPLDANMDISALAGRTLIVSERDGAPNRRTGGHLTLQKAASVGNQPSIMSSNSKLFTSTSTDDNYDQSPKASSASGKQSKQKWTIPFGSKGPQKSKLCELLDSYNKEIPKSTSSSSNFNNPEYVDALVGLRNLPQCWTDIVNCAGMSEAETKIQSAIWELVTTEVYYILALQTVTDLFLACLEDIQSQNILTDVDQNKLFSNIRDIWEANLRFWTLYLHPMVKHSQRTKDPMSIYYFQRGFVDFATIFTPYTKYCAEQSTCQFYCKEMYHNNALFMTYCAWCESQKMCNRLRLADILVRPMQRLTKYGLLLAAIKKHINDEAEGEAIDAMIHSVEEFVAGVNSHLTTRQESERLKGINARIDCYEVVDSNNETLDRLVKQHSIMFDLCQPMRGIDHGRKVFVEGDLKYKDGTGKMDVHCFLFTDFLLVCKKNKNDKLKIVRQPYMTDRLMVQLKDQAIYCCYVNELNMVVAAFTLQSAKAQHWYDSITKVKHIYNRMKQGTFGDVRQYGNIINISNSCNNSTSNSNMNINNDNISIKKSPLNSSIGSRVSSLNNSHSGSVDLNESKQVSIDFEKTNSLSSDEGAGVVNAVTGSGLVMMHSKYGAVSSRKPKNTVCTMQTKSSNSLTVQPYSGLGQSMPNLNLNSIQNSNTLSVPGTSNSQSHSGMVLLSPSQRGISYPPPSPTRATLRRGFAFSTSIKNPPLIKTRNVSSQQSFALSQQQSFNSASLAQHQQCLPSPSNTSHGAPNNSGTNSAIEGCAVASGLTLSSANVSFFKRKNSFQSVPNNSATSSVDQSLPNET
ncbi:pleckstrin homology domain-containing family G member 5 isoform X1 [Anopheles arabiensis]|uniref:pleckstrin homology domain-containing family G member 5 isoform X1 n=1 Tax=Anopheles arabiensis TaxID=7173 RepID=UPI001AADF605|nr:pleckstrin homology domain-containing family G member 5 isoform X1 [Anopheles arabiensis]